MPTLCTVSGDLYDLAGNLLPNQALSLTRVDVLGQDGSTVIPKNYEVISDGSGAVSFDVFPGNYTGVVSINRRVEKFALAVPEAATANLHDIIDQAAVPITPSDVLVAQAAAADALGYRDEAEAFKDQALVQTISSDPDIRNDSTQLASRGTIEGNLYLTGNAAVIDTAVDDDLDNAIEGGVYTLTGSYQNGPSGAAAATITGVMTVIRRDRNSGPRVVQSVITGGSIFSERRRVGTGNPVVWGEWENPFESVYFVAASSSQTLSENDGTVSVEIAGPIAVPAGDYLVEVPVQVFLFSGGTAGEPIYGDISLAITNDADDQSLSTLSSALIRNDRAYFSDSLNDDQTIREIVATRSLTLSVTTDIDFTINLDTRAQTDTAQDIQYTTRFIKLTKIVELA